MYKVLLVVLGFALAAHAQFITAVQSSSLTPTGATITWSTCTPASTSVKYGTTAAYGATTPQVSALVIAHVVQLTGLLPSTTYHFAPNSSDSVGASVSGSDLSFTTLSVPPPPPPSTVTSFWPASQIPGTPSTTDTQAVELGIRFTSDTAGQIVAIRFYKGSGNTGTHTGTVWVSSGTKLFSGTFANETASGWQELAVSPPVSIIAGASYTVSYHDPNSHYASDQPYFNVKRDVPPLHAGIGAGVYVYGSSPAFPTSVWNNSNYWVDVKLSTGTAPPPPCNPPNTVVNGVCTPPTPPVCNPPNTLVNGVCTPPAPPVCNPPSTVINGVCTPPASPLKPQLSWSASPTASLSRGARNKAPAPPTMSKGKRADSKRKLGVVITYNLYRGATPGGPYAPTNSQPITALTYRDVSAAPATTYYYIVRAFNPANNLESVNSNEVKVVVP